MPAQDLKTCPPHLFPTTYTLDAEGHLQDPFNLPLPPLSRPDVVALADAFLNSPSADAPVPLPAFSDWTYRVAGVSGGPVFVTYFAQGGRPLVTLGALFGDDPSEEKRALRHLLDLHVRFARQIEVTPRLELLRVHERPVVVSILLTIFTREEAYGTGQIVPLTYAALLRLRPTPPMLED